MTPILTPRPALSCTLLAPFALMGCAPLASTQALPETPVAIGQTGYVGGLKVTPLALLEDSRCPVNVQCVWAGQVKVRVKVTGGAWSKDMELVTAEAQDIADGAITLASVTPERTSHRAPRPKEYRFSFTFDGGL